MALITLMNRLISSLENDECILGIFIDFLKAFDTVDHVILLKKSWHTMGLGALLWNGLNVISAIGNNMWHKMACLRLNKGSSVVSYRDLYLVLCYFLFFLHDRPWISPSIKSISNELDITRHVFASQWSGQAINEVQKTKFLGIVIDNQLTWKWHINYIAGKIARGIGMLIKARPFLNKVGLMSRYYSFIYPYLTNCNHIWGATYKTRLKRLVILQNKAIRVSAQAGNRTVLIPCIRNWILWNLKISTLISLTVLCVVCPLIRFHNPLGVCSEKKNNEFHNYDTRSAHHLHLPSVKLDLSKTGIKYPGAIVWNLISQTWINLEVSEAVFKKSLINTDGL